ncbi:Bromodomain-containing protein [Tirmania nivea]|nr:Bromodomain-containing protein [Tirmania nivea]
MVDAPASLVKTGREREEDDDEESQERPSKRAKTDELEDKPLMSQASTSTGPMPKVQAKYALQTIRTIRRTKDAGPFLIPVDPVKLAIPTYFDYVKNPMDLSTMEKKLQADQYATVEDFVKDFKLIISNCLTFNGTEHKISEMARGIEATFERQMKNMPPPDQQEPPEKKSHKKGSSSKIGGSKPKTSAPPKAASPPVPVPVPAPAPAPTPAPPLPAAISPTTQSQTFALDPSGMPTIRRESVQSDGRPKREIHPPPPRDLPYSDVKPRRKKTAAELKFCDQVMKELQKKQHEAYAYPFYNPVDPVALNIPDYFRIIKKPMDLSTMQNKLKTNQYDNANEFEADMRLMLSNCYKFNPTGTAVHAMGKKVEEVFNKKWAEKTAFIQSQSGSRSPVSASPAPDEEGEMSGEEDPQVEILQKQLEMMQKQLEAMKGKKKSPPAQVQGSKKGKAGGPAAGRKGSMSQSASQRKKAVKKVEEVPLLSMEEKTELSQRINLLSPSKMMYATKLIQENLPNLSGDDEIELDIDDLPPEILYKLHQYVTKHAPLAPQNTEYGYSAPPAPAATPKPKAAPRPKKNKPMSATEQEAKIKDLNAKLAVFENPSPLVRQNTNQSTSEAVEAQEEEESSSDDDESSNSESEEE